ncbi:MAG TPA: DUF6152 family protein [Gammaproteobacteria bacterium]|nr:DUF6152 family protein [Gammaproteobacteria bacterium]
MNVLRKLFVLGMSLVVAGAAWAHHSFAMFDLEKEVTVEGTVKEFQWTNPHCWLQVMVPDGKGGVKEWSFEMGAMGMLARTGWKSSTLKPNDKVTVVMNPLKSGGQSGRLLKVTLPDGRVMGPGGSAPPPKPAA